MEDDALETKVYMRL